MDLSGSDIRLEHDELGQTKPTSEVTLFAHWLRQAETDCNLKYAHVRERQVQWKSQSEAGQSDCANLVAQMLV